MKAISCTQLLVLGVAVFSTCCTHTAVPNRSSEVPPAYVELFRSASVATVHFPRGLYSLDASDSTGFYYRAPRGLIQHSFAGAQSVQGGVFVSRRDERALRGYVIWAGGITKIGSLSGKPHAFRD